MKTKLIFALSLLALSLAPLPTLSTAEAAKTCSQFCATVRCIGGYVCGPYVNSSGATVCGCHPIDIRP